MAASQNPNNPTTGADYSKWMAQGQTSGPYGNDPDMDARGQFAQPAKDLRP